MARIRQLNQVLKLRWGASLIELLLVIGIVGILAGVGVTNFIGFKHSQDLEGAVKTLEGQLRAVQQKAMSQEQSAHWGIRVNVPDPGADSYTVFYCTDCVSAVTETEFVSLPGSVQFLSPIQGSAATDIIFSKLTSTKPAGALQSGADTTIVLASTSNPALSKTINISAIGLIELVGS